MSRSSARPARSSGARRTATSVCCLLLAVALAGCGIGAGSPAPATGPAAPPASSPPTPAPDLIGSWKTGPTNFTGQLAYQAVTVNISDQSAGGTLDGTLLYYGDGIIEPTETVPVTGNIKGLTISLSGAGGSLTGTYSLTISASITFTATVQTASGTQSLSGVLYRM
jgi:hypothetical protein